MNWGLSLLEMISYGHSGEGVFLFDIFGYNKVGYVSGK